MTPSLLEPLEPRRLLTSITDSAAWRITSPGDETLSSQAVDSAGNVYVSGAFKGTVDFNPSSSKIFNVTAANAAGDAFVAKFSSTGGLYWVWRLGDASITSPVVNDLAIDKVSGSLLVGGGFSGFYDFGKIGSGDASLPGLSLNSTGGSDGFWARVNTKTGLPTAVGRVSGAAANKQSLNDTITQIDSDAVGNLTVAGLFAETRPTGSGPAIYDDVLITKFSASGRFIWQQHISTSLGDLSTMFLAVDPAGTVFLAGNAPFGADITFVGKHGSTGFFSAPPRSSYIGSFDAATGATIRLKVLGPSQGTGVPSPIISDLTLNHDGNLVVVGTVPGGIDISLGQSTAVISHVGYSDGFVAKYSQRGGLIWWQRMGDDSDDTNYIAGDDGAESVAVDAQNNIYVGGHGSVDLFFIAKTPRTNFGSGKFLAKYSASGAFLAAAIVKAPVSHLAAAPKSGVFAAGIRFLGINPNLQGDVVVTRLE